VLLVDAVMSPAELIFTSEVVKAEDSLTGELVIEYVRPPHSPGLVIKVLYEFDTPDTI
jgi:hypothetical protein